MEVICNETKREVIEKLGKEWDIVPMDGVLGNVLAAEVIPTKLPVIDGIFIIENISWDIAEVSEDYPFSSILRSRIDRERRKVALSNEIYHAEMEKLQKDKKEDLRKDMLDFYQFASGAKKIYGV
jgi:hypothetical protein